MFVWQLTDGGSPYIRTIVALEFSIESTVMLNWKALN
jgi:hypothetical protein